MRYEVILKTRNSYERFEETLLDIFDKKAIEQTECTFVRELGLCDVCAKTCDLNTRCHVLIPIRDGVYSKHCPVLFCDIVRPKWTPDNLM